VPSEKSKMATPAFGRIEEYCLADKADFVEYIERLTQYFIANEITDGGIKKAILLTAVGKDTYSLVRTLVSPEKPAEKSYDQLVAAIKAHVSPKPLVIAERFKFYQRKQRSGEAVNTFMAELRKLSEHCDFGGFLDDALRDMFVCGLASAAMQRKLLAEKNLTVRKSLEIAFGMEAASKETNEFSHKTNSVGRMSADRSHRHPERRDGDSSREFRECWRCGKSNHSSDNCFHKKSVCHNCNKTGHLSRKCTEKSQSRRSTSERKQSPRQGKLKKKSSKVRFMDTERNDVHSDLTGDSDNSECEPRSQADAIFTVKSMKDDKPINIQLLLEGTKCSMELDTGAGVTLISENHYKRDFYHIPLKPSNLPYLRTYTDECLPVLGLISVDVEYNKQCMSLPIHVVKGDGPALLGRNWLSKIQLNWNSITRINKVRSENEEAGVSELLSKYATLFDDSLGTVKGVKLHLSVKPGAKPKFYKPRPVPFAMQDKVAEELDRLESIGVIEKVAYSEWAAPIVPVLKPTGAVRICGDYKVTINQDLEVPQYPLPIPEDLFSKLNGGQKFTKLDLSHAYQQVLLDNESRKYVTINTHKGLYRYTRLPFGVSSAPAMFQNVMDQVLQGLPATGDFIDDLYVTGRNTAEHLQNLENVLSRLESYGIKLNKSKCTFLQPSMEYLGFLVDRDGIHPTKSKVEAIQNAPRPTTVTELQSFLGCVNYYRKFIPNMSTLCSPLNKLLQKDTKFCWDTACENAYQKLCDILSTSDVLVHYDPEKSMILAADASQAGLGCVISHDTNDGEKPIAYASRTLSAAERNYSQIEKEALAIIFGIQKFHKYLFGRRFTLYTDHKPLTTILGPKTGIPVLAASRLQRWAIQLSAYTYDIKYKTTKQNANADFLSRLPLRGENSSHAPDDFWSREATRVHTTQLERLPITAKEIATVTRTDHVLSRVKHFTVCGWPASGDVSAELLPFYRRKDELTCEEGCLLWGVRVVIPPRYREIVLGSLHDAHPGIVKMKSLARLHVWWPNLDADIEQLVRECEMCQSVLPNPESSRQNPWIWPSRPYQRIHIDYAGPFMGGNFLIVVDARSKWPEVIPMTSTTTTSTITELRKLFSSYGIPDQLVSDNGPQFTSYEFQEFLSRNGVKHILSSPYHPSSNGEAERFVRTFKTAMRSMKSSSATFQQKLCRFLLAYRTTPHSTTKTTPSELFMGRRVRTKMDILRPDLAATIQKKISPVGDVKRAFEIGEPVLVRDYRGRAETWITGVIVKSLGPVTYRVQVDNLLWKRHVDQLRSVTSRSVATSSATDDMCAYDSLVDDDAIPCVQPSVDDALSVSPSTPMGVSVDIVPTESGESVSPRVQPESEPVCEVTRRYPTRVRKQPERLSY